MLFFRVSSTKANGRIPEAKGITTDVCSLLFFQKKNSSDSEGERSLHRASIPCIIRHQLLFCYLPMKWQKFQSIMVLRDRLETNELQSTYLNSLVLKSVLFNIPALLLASRFGGAYAWSRYLLVRTMEPKRTRWHPNLILQPTSNSMAVPLYLGTSFASTTKGSPATGQPDTAYNIEMQHNIPAEVS